jgi:hypothetical protein
MRRILTVAVTVLIGAIAASCTPEEIALFQSLPADQQTAVLETLWPSEDCNAAIDRWWPGDRAWAKRIAWRESRNTPTARNASGASGCLQMMLPLHNRRFTAVGCSPSQWSNAACNIKAAWHLYQEVGPSPWNL